ncbi:MAG: (S)-ureidoglycine aminohydrolase [Acidobacteriota bacterium]
MTPDISTTQSVPFGTTRTRVTRSYAFIAPDSHVVAPAASWTEAPSVHMISPRMGAEFSMYLVLGQKGSRTTAAAEGVERFLYVEEGDVRIAVDGEEDSLGPGGYLFVPADREHLIESQGKARLWLLEKRFVERLDAGVPRAIVGNVDDVVGAPFLGDPDAVLKTLLPDEPEYDLAMNLFTYQPGATLPFAETHIMEHGMLMTAGAGVYRLDEDWFPVQKGDVMWIGPYCPQWFVAMGKQPASYLYYKDVNRDPLAE